MIGWYGTAMLCYVTPKEHLGLPDKNDVKGRHHHLQDRRPRRRPRQGPPRARRRATTRCRRRASSSAGRPVQPRPRPRQGARPPHGLPSRLRRLLHRALRSVRWPTCRRALLMHLTSDYRCSLFGSDRRLNACCSGLAPSVEMCGNDRGPRPRLAERDGNWRLRRRTGRGS